MASGLRTRLERALQLELPGADISDEILAALLEAYEEQAGEAEAHDGAHDGLVERWFGFLITFVPNQVDDSAVREVCRGVLRRLSGDSAPDRPADGAAAQAAFQRPAQELPGLREMLTEQDLLMYDVHAWCENHNVTTMDELAQRSEACCDDLQMKNKQRKRLQKTLASRAKPKPMVQTTSSGEPSVFGPPDDPYTITRLLGTGATAQVYECTRGGNAFAAKVISLATMRLQPNFEEVLTKLRREKDILFSLRHERVVSLYATYETDNYMFLVMEIVQGFDLFEHMGHVGLLSEDEALCVFLQLVDALSYIHGQRVVHRDLKLENILVSSKLSSGKLEVKVTDFGHSKLIKDGMALTVVGTHQYWAPEVALLRSALGYDFSVDLWSLGVVLYVMLEGCYPFNGPNMADQILQGDVQFGLESRASRDAQDLVRRLIQVEHSRRISLSGCLEHAWCCKARGASTAPAAAPQAAASAAALPSAAGGRKGGCSKRTGAT